MNNQLKEQRENSSDRLATAMRKEVKALLSGGRSHTKFAKVVDQFPVRLRGTVPEGLPYSAWQVLEHMRITQQYMLDYSKHDLLGQPRTQHKNLSWPRNYWVKRSSPMCEAEWDKTIATILNDRNEFERLFDEASDDTLIKTSSPRTRKTILRLALQMSDHNAYHLGQLVIIRRLLRAWK